VFDWTTVVVSGGVGIGAVWATLHVSKKERQADRELSAEERREQRRLFDAALSRSEADRYRAETELLDAVRGELVWNLAILNRTAVNRAFVLFEIDTVKRATWAVAALPDDTRIQIQEARYAMSSFNTLASAVNQRQPGVTIASEPPLDPNELPKMAEVARPIIDLARAKLETVIKERRAAQP
jgi:ferredoxin-NADP reductase